MNIDLPWPAMAQPARRPTKITLYQYAECFESARVRRRLRELDLQFRAETLSPGDKSVVRYKFGSQSVPVLQDGPFTSGDLGEILAHIDKTYGGSRAKNAASGSRPKA